MANELIKIDGKIEATGQVTFDRTCHIYAYLRVIDDNGSVIMLKEVITKNTVNSYISINAKGSFFFVKLKSTYILFAFLGHDRMVYDQDDMNDLISDIRKQSSLWIAYTMSSFFAILIGGIGLLLIPFCLYQCYNFLFKIPSALSENRLKPFLSENGFKFTPAYY